MSPILHRPPPGFLVPLGVHEYAERAMVVVGDVAAGFGIEVVVEGEGPIPVGVALPLAIGAVAARELRSWIPLFISAR